MATPGSLGLGAASFGPGDCGCGDHPPCILTICGTVGGCNAFYLEGADVELTWDGGGASLTTDANGRYCFDNPVLNPGDPDVTISYTISYPGLVTATGTFTVGCLGPGTIPKIDLTPDDDHVCACNCVNPFRKVIDIATDKASGVLTWDGTSQWTGTLEWFEATAVKPISGSSDLGATCHCCIEESGQVRGKYTLGCALQRDAYGNLVWMWGLNAGFNTCVQAKAISGSPQDNDCYQIAGTIPGPFVPWCDSQGATTYDSARQTNIDYVVGAGANGFCDWSDLIPLDCNEFVLDFFGNWTPSQTALCDNAVIPGRATITL